MAHIGEASNVLNAYLIGNMYGTHIVFTDEDNIVIDMNTLNPKPWKESRSRPPITYRLMPINTLGLEQGCLVQFVPEDESLADTENHSTTLLQSYRIPIADATRINEEFKKLCVAYEAGASKIDAKFYEHSMRLRTAVAEQVDRLQSIQEKIIEAIDRATRREIITLLGPAPSLEEMLKSYRR